MAQSGSDLASSSDTKNLWKKNLLLKKKICALKIFLVLFTQGNYFKDLTKWIVVGQNERKI